MAKGKKDKKDKDGKKLPFWLKKKAKGKSLGDGKKSKKGNKDK